MDTSSPVRLLLLEFLVPGRLRDESAMYFPFLKGFARAHGIDTQWVCFGARHTRWWHVDEGRTTYVSLPAKDAATLDELCRGFAPTHVVTNELLEPEARAVIEQARPGCRLLVFPQGIEVFFATTYPSRTQHDMRAHIEVVGDGDEGQQSKRIVQRVARTRWFARWLGRPELGEANAYFVESVLPDYATLPGNAEALDVQAPLLIVSGSGCMKRPSVCHNPTFSKLDFDGMFLTTGCSFCGGSEVPPPHSASADRAEIVERQFRAVLASATTSGRQPGLYDIFDLDWFLRIDDFFALVFRLGLPPSTFIFGPRIDDVLAVREKIEVLLPQLAEAGHAIRLEIMGLESFSEAQMRLFNKDISVAMLDDLLDTVEDWDRRHHAVFNLLESGMNRRQWSMILFTPWTTLEDTRINLTEAARRGFEGNDLWLFSCLMIRQGTPLAVLAEREGDILVDRFEDPGLGYFPLLAIRDLYGVLPWRFRHAPVGRLYRLLVRVCAFELDGPASPFFVGDLDFEAVARQLAPLRSAQEAHSDNTGSFALRVAQELLAMLSADDAPGEDEALLEAALEPVRSALRAAAKTAADAQAAPKEEDAMPAPPELPLLQRLFAGLARKQPRAFAGVTFEGVSVLREAGGEPAIGLHLRLGERDLSLRLHGPEHEGPFLFASARYRVSHDGETGLASPEERVLVARLLRMIDAALDRQS